MNCEWCYVPFEAPVPREEIVAAVVHRIADLGFYSLTIGGGDPFQYRFLPTILQLAKARGLFVHVDTHGRGLRESAENLLLIESAVDLLGLPIDGASPAVHDSMRSSPGHFELVARRLRWLVSLRGRLKVNTIVSAVNAHEIGEISSLVASHHPARWSIYQYWPLGPAARVAARHSLSDADFLRSADHAHRILFGGPTIVEVNTMEARRDTYPIVHHNGEVFVHATYPENVFVPLGSLFEEDTLPQILSHCSPDRPNATNRYLKQAMQSPGASDG
jgi:MoaA/NifB/PqqE/SkfB family radical SAM enzyme